MDRVRDETGRIDGILDKTEKVLEYNWKESWIILETQGLW